MGEIKKLANSFERTLKDSNLQSVSIEILEVLSDSVMNEGLLKDIPIIGTIVGVSKASLNIKDSLFLKKIVHFITELKNVDLNTRNKIISEIDNSRKFKIKVGEKLLYIIDKCEDHINSQTTAKLFTAFLKEKISYSEFLRSTSIIQKIHLEDLEYFLSDKVELEKEIEVQQYEGISEIEFNLINVGLLITETGILNIRDQDDWKMDEKYIVEGGNITISPTKIGYLIKEILKTTANNQ